MKKSQEIGQQDNVQNILLSRKVALFSKVPFFLLRVFFFSQLLVQKFDPEESSHSNISLNDLNRDGFKVEHKLLFRSFHNFVLGIETVFTMNVFENFFKKASCWIWLRQK